MQRPYRVAVVTNILPAYRIDFYSRIFASQEIEVKVFCQSSVYKNTISSADHLLPQENVHHFKTWYPFKDRFPIQLIPFRSLISEYDLVILDGNFRHLTQWILGICRRLLGKKIAIWSSFTHPGRGTGHWLRTKLFALAPSLLMYTPEDSQIAEQVGLRPKINMSIYNGMNQDAIEAAIAEWDADKLAAWQSEMPLLPGPRLISSGRLIGNRYKDLMSIFPDLLGEFPELQWIVIGNGPDLTSMEAWVKSNQLDKHVLLLGGLFEEKQMAPWFLSSQLFIFPYAIGLSIFHAFGYGLPVLTHNYRIDHGPEFTAMESGKTGYLYQQHNTADLHDKLKLMLADPEMLARMGKYSQQVIRTSFNTGMMSRQFVSFVKKVCDEG